MTLSSRVPHERRGVGTRDDGMEDRLRSRRLRRQCLSVEGGSRGRERMVEGLDRFPPCQWVENEAGSLAPVLDLDAEFVLEVAAVPKQVDDDSVGVAVLRLKPD